VAHALLRMVDHVLADGTVYRGAGADYHDRQHRQPVTRRVLQGLMPWSHDADFLSSRDLQFVPNL